MEAIQALAAEDVKIDKFPCRGEMHDVIGISVRWLSKHGQL